MKRTAYARRCILHNLFAAVVGHIWCKSWWVESASVAGSYWHGAYTLVICNRSCMSMYRSCEWKTIFHSNLWGFSFRCLSWIYDRPPSVSSVKHKSPMPTSTFRLEMTHYLHILNILVSMTTSQQKHLAGRKVA